jgi:hypothetical protein
MDAMSWKQTSPETGREYREDGSIINVANKIGEMLGQDGSIWIADTSPHTPTAGKVYI